jgi:hypothetical protein
MSSMGLGRKNAQGLTLLVATWAKWRSAVIFFRVWSFFRRKAVLMRVRAVLVGSVG